MTNLVPPTPKELQVYYQEDEINLLDIFLVLVKRKKVIAIVAGVCIVIGIVFSFTTSKVYTYSTSIEIGATGSPVSDDGFEENVNQQLKLIDNPNTVLAKIQESYILVVQREYFNSNPDIKVFKIKARIPKGSELIVLESKGTEELKETHLYIHQQILNRLIQDHKKRIDVTRNQYQVQIEKNKLILEGILDPSTLDVARKALDNELIRAKLKLEELRDPKVLAVPKKGLEREISLIKLKQLERKDQIKLIKEQVKRLDEVERLLQKQSADLNDQINTVILRRQDALKEVSDEAKAMTMLLIDNEIQQNRDRLAGIEERLYVTLKNQRGQLDKSLADNRREQEIQDKEILDVEGKLEKLILDNRRDQARQRPIVAELEAQLKKLESDHVRDISSQRHKIRELEIQSVNLRETHAVTPPIQSLRAKGTSRLLIVSLSIILGVIFGIIAAFIFEFLDKAKLRLAEQKV